ncbi:AAA family ATPase, partial [Pseudoalteromonas sp. CR1]|nr:AAA family ATPase [Pseudoalteromonas sp. CR1]
VVVAPAQKNMRLQGSGEALRRTLFRRPLVSGDVISTSTQSRAASDPRVPPELRPYLEGPSYGLQEIRLVVVATQPRGIVYVAEGTQI